MKTDKKLMRQMVIDFIKSGKTLGKTFGEIQRFVVEDLHGYNYDDMNIKYDYWKYNSYKPARKYRGYWCVNLLGAKWRTTPGILPSYCSKINKRWIHNDFKKFL